MMFEMVDHGALLCMGGVTSHLGRAAPRVGFGGKLLQIETFRQPPFTIPFKYNNFVSLG